MCQFLFWFSSHHSSLKFSRSVFLMIPWYFEHREEFFIRKPLLSWKFTPPWQSYSPPDRKITVKSPQGWWKIHLIPFITAVTWSLTASQPLPFIQCKTLTDMPNRMNFTNGNSASAMASLHHDPLGSIKIFDKTKLAECCKKISTFVHRFLPLPPLTPPRLERKVFTLSNSKQQRIALYES